MVFRIFVASYTDDVYTLSFDGDKLTLTSSVEVGFQPSWITPHPRDKALFFTCLEQDEGKIVAIRYDEEGKGKVVARTSYGGGNPCSVVAAEDQLFIANYLPGSVTVLPISDSAPYLLDEAPATTTLHGSGPNETRQEASHAHQVFYNNAYNELLVPDLGGDRVYRFVKDLSGSWKIGGHVQYEGGNGPRHVAVHDGHLYTLLELTSTLSRHKYPPNLGEPKFITQVSTLSKPLPLPNDMLAAEILLPKPNPSFPVPYIYVSNRNDPSPEGDTIAIFSIANPDALELIAEVRTGLNHLRGMQFGGPDDKYLVAGGANGGGVKVLERIDGGKNLKVVASNDKIKSPTGFWWA